MEEPCRVSFSAGRLASRKAEEAACRRFLAAEWLQNMVGPLGLPTQPSEQDFVTCLRNGLVLCNIINKIQPGAVPKVVTIQTLGSSCEIQPLPAYQYFENVRNFLVAVNELKLPSFEASDLERDTVEAGSAAKIVDCVIGLKTYYEWKQSDGGTGSRKFAKSPMVAHAFGRTQNDVGPAGTSVSCRRLDLPDTSEKLDTAQNENSISEDSVTSLVKVLSDCLLNSKENIGHKLLDSWHSGAQDSVKLFAEIISSCFQQKQVESIVKDLLMNGSKPITDPPTIQVHECCNSCQPNGGSKPQSLLEARENELLELKALLLRTRMEFEMLHSQLHSDFTLLGTHVQGLSAAAIGYDQAVKENKNLYNMLQELRGNIQVFCRIRPTCNTETKCSIDYVGHDGSLIVIDPFNSQSTRRIFQFNKVFGPDATQDEVYKDTQSLIRSVMDGYNVCIFAYGQTGSGKTHTMCGPANGVNKNTGVNCLALSDLFQISSTRDDIKYDIQVQMVEIYNEQVRDLLAEHATNTKLEIRSCSTNGGLSVPDASMCSVQSVHDVLDLMKLGEKNRVFCSTAINHRSSRSHSVLTIHIHGKYFTGSTIRSCLNLVDLAGSERVDKSEVTGDRLKEAQHINKSLSCLGDVITALAQKSSHIPYRNSKLTQMLQNSLGGHAKVLMFAHVSPEPESYGETISTLKFAQRVSTVELGAARLNKESTEILELKEQIDSLKKALARKDVENQFNSHNMKENRPTYEKQNQIQQTPPRSRRLSIDSVTLQKAGAAKNIDNKMGLRSPVFQTDHTPPRSRWLSIENGSLQKTKIVSKCPISAPKFGREHTPISFQKLSNDVSNCEGLQLETNLHTDMLGGLLLAQDQATFGGPDLEENMNNEACNGLLTSPYQNQQPKIDRGSSLPLQQPKTPVPMRKLDDAVTRNDVGLNKSQAMTSITNSSSRGSQIRKSLQTIGKLINGSEKRKNHCVVEAPSSVYGSNKNDDKSPMSADARFCRRQSLTNLQTTGSNFSRRSSLGGKSTALCSSNIQTGRTPLVQSSSKAAKRWL